MSNARRAVLALLSASSPPPPPPPPAPSRSRAAPGPAPGPRGRSRSPSSSPRCSAGRARRSRLRAAAQVKKGEKQTYGIVHLEARTEVDQARQGGPAGRRAGHPDRVPVGAGEGAALEGAVRQAPGRLLGALPREAPGRRRHRRGRAGPGRGAAPQRSAAVPVPHRAGPAGPRRRRAELAGRGGHLAGAGSSTPARWCCATRPAAASGCGSSTAG